MAKQLQLTIPTPCHENWEAMTPVEKGRYCGACQKQVVDFSTMSDRQVAEFFKKPSTGSVCGRFMPDQLDRDIEIPRKRIPWVKYFFQFALPAFLLSMKSSVVKAQGAVAIILKDEPVIKIPICKKPVIGDTITMPEVVVRASVPVKGKVSNTVSVLQGKVAGPVIVIPDKQSNIADCRDLSFKAVNVSQALQGRVGGVTVVRGGASAKATRNKEKKKIPLLKQLFKDSTANFFRIFPNPVASGSNITIECKQAEEGYYAIQLLNQSGQSAHQQEIWIDGGARSLSINVPFVAAGSYILVLTNKKTGKKFTEKIIIQ